MTVPRHPGHDDDPVDALVADRYLDALLAAHGGGPASPPPHLDAGSHDAHETADAPIDPALAGAARVLQRSLVRVHPSFRFEERLAGRLADLAAAQSGRAAAAAGGGRVIPFPGGASTVGRGGADDPLLPAILAGELDPTDEAALERAEPAGIDRRPLIVGGALTSAAISIVGVAYVAWRASRPGSRAVGRFGGRGAAGTMARAARTAHARRVADALDRAGMTGGTA